MRGLRGLRQPSRLSLEKHRTPVRGSEISNDDPGTNGRHLNSVGPGHWVGAALQDLYRDRYSSKSIVAGGREVRKQSDSKRSF